MTLCYLFTSHVSTLRKVHEWENLSTNMHHTAHCLHVPVSQRRVIYQKSLPEGDVDCTRSGNSFTGQTEAHQDLCAAANRKNNLGERRGRVDLSAYFTVHQIPHAFITVGPGLLCYPKTSWLFLDKAMQRFAGIQQHLVCLLSPIPPCSALFRSWLSALHGQ